MNKFKVLFYLSILFGFVVSLVLALTQDDDDNNDAVLSTWGFGVGACGLAINEFFAYESSKLWYGTLWVAFIVTLFISVGYSSAEGTFVSVGLGSILAGLIFFFNVQSVENKVNDVCGYGMVDDKQFLNNLKKARKALNDNNVQIQPMIDRNWLSQMEITDERIVEMCEDRDTNVAFLIVKRRIAQIETELEQDDYEYDTEINRIEKTNPKTNEDTRNLNYYKEKRQNQLDRKNLKEQLSKKK